MRRTTATNVLAFLTLVTLGATSAHAVQAAGTFYGAGALPGLNVPIVDALTFHRDGTFTGTANDDYGFGDIATNGFTSPEHGAWRQFGAQRIGTSSLSLGYNANGVLENIVRIDSNIEFSSDSTALTGVFRALIFLPGQNPLADAPAAVLPGGTFALDRLGSAESPGDIAARVAGTYYGTGTATGIDATIVDALTFNEDGTFTGTANDDFGFGDIAANGFNSPEQGTWRQTGPRSIETRSLAFGYSPGGAMETIYRIDSTAEFSEDFATLNGEFAVNVFLPDQDPLNDDPVASIPGAYRVNRLGAEQAASDIRELVAGTYFGTGNVEGIDASIVDILTFNEDGTFTGTANDDYGFGDIAANGFNSPEHGTWRQTGPRSIETSSLAFGYDANGVLENIFRIDSTAEFTEDFATLNGELLVKVFLADQDPLEDDPVATLPGTYTVARLVPVPEPGGIALAGLLFAGLLVLTRLRTVVACLAILVCAQAATAAILIDDFNDGDDVGWTRVDTSIGTPWGPGSIDPSSGSYVFQGGGDVSTGERGMLLALYDASNDPKFQDGYLRATVRTGNDTLAYLVMRGDLATSSAYVFGASATTGRFWWNKVVNNVILEEGPTFEPDPPFAVGEDWIIEGGVVGDQLSVRVWRVGDPESAAPQWTHTDNTFAAGQFALGANHWAEQPPSTVNATFDNVYFTPVPEPSGLTLAGVLLAGVLAIRRIRPMQGIACTLALLTLTLGNVARAAPYYFFDDFEDGNATDGAPATWAPGYYSGGSHDVVEGDYVISRGGGVANALALEGLETADVLVRSQFRFRTSGLWGGLSVRTADNGTYYAGIQPNGDLFLGEIVSGSAGTSHGSRSTSLRPTDEDVILEFAAIGDRAFLYAWSADGERPPGPQLAMRSNAFLSGSYGMWVENMSIAFRWFEAAEPINLPFGDADHDGDVDLDDLNAVRNNFGGPARGTFADTDFDGDVDLDDLNHVRNLFGAGAGEANGVPEPTGLALAATCLISLLVARHQLVRSLRSRRPRGPQPVHRR